MFCCAVPCAFSSFAVVFMRKRERERERERELVALLCLSSWCLVTFIVLWLFFAVPWASLPSVIVVLPDHTRLLFSLQRQMVQFDSTDNDDYQRSSVRRPKSMTTDHQFDVLMNDRRNILTYSNEINRPVFFHMRHTLTQ